MSDGFRELVSAWLAELRFLHAFVVVGEFRADGAVRIAAEGCPTFHHVRRGRCAVQLQDGARHTLEAGDVLLMRSGLDRIVSHGAGQSFPRPLREMLTRVLASGRISRFECGPSGEGATVLGAAARLADQEVPALIALPPIAILRAEDVPRRLAAALDLLVEEAAADVPVAAAPIVARLAESVFLMAARAVLIRGQALPPLAMAARDRRLSRVLVAIHRDVARPWTVRSLARLAGMSRSAFAQSFTAVLGISPMRYVTAERMRQASVLLREDATIQEAAEAVGYASAPAFSTAFRRLRGRPPSALRSTPTVDGRHSGRLSLYDS